MSTPDYRISSASVAGMDDDALFWAVIENARPDVAEPDVMQKLQHCTPGQRALLSITLFIREVDNGGLEQFFWNSSGDVGDEVMTGFDRLGAPQKADILRRALAFFNSASATPDQATRRQLLGRHSEGEKDAFFEPLNKQLYGETKLWPLFRRYLDAHPDEFFVDSASR